MNQPDAFHIDEAAAEIVRTAAGTGVKVTSVEQWGRGALNDTLKVCTLHPAETFFIKIERQELLPRTRRGQIEREVAGIRLAKQAGIRVPEVLAYEVTGSQVGRKYLVEAFIDAELFWEIRDSLTEPERQALKEDIQVVLEQMNSITSPLFGDVYPHGVIGQHASWQEAYRAMSQILLADCAGLDIYPAQDLRVVEEAFCAGAEKLVSRHPAGFNHGDLGMHNVMVDRSPGFARLGQVIDFGNATFGPIYSNEEGTRLHGGFGLEPLDVEARYGISPAEHQADDLLGWFEMVVFFGMLKKKYDYNAPPIQVEFLEACKKSLL